MSQFFQLLLKDHHYLMLVSHIHQGLTIDVDKNIDERFSIYKILLSIMKHKSQILFPANEHIYCPVFLQDKWGYISKVPHLFLPSLRISTDIDKKNLRRLFYSPECQKFLQNNNEEENGWIVKLPFTTNQIYKKKDSVNTLFEYIGTLIEKVKKAIPYIFIQACLQNRKEWKVICYNGIPQHILIKKSSRKCTAEVGNIKDITFKNELMDFARNANVELACNCPAFLISGETRVDIMYCAYLQKYVVNEFESLEALWETSNVSENNNFHNSMVNYWHGQLMSICKDLNVLK